MRKLLLLFAILLVCAPAGYAQSDYSNWEFFIGYAHERANNGADRLDRRGLAVNSNGTTSRVDFGSERIPYNGVTGEVVANVTPHIGLVTNFAATFANTDFLDALRGRSFHARVSRYTCSLARGTTGATHRRSYLTRTRWSAWRATRPSSATATLPVPIPAKLLLRWRWAEVWTSGPVNTLTSAPDKLTICRFSSVTNEKMVCDSRRA